MMFYEESYSVCLVPNLEHILKTRRSAMTVKINHHEMHRDTVFTSIVDLDMYHDTVSLVVFSRVPASSVSAIARVLPCVSCLCW